jgi:hypothetical protein
MAAGKQTKKPATTVIRQRNVWSGESWTVHFGELRRGVGHPGKTPNLFRCIGELLPYDALDQVRKQLDEKDITAQGVYIAHDSMGCPRYAGRGDIFVRLKGRKKAQRHELAYFSFYVVADKKHEREIETLIIRSAGFLLEFNDRKKQSGIWAGNVDDYEAGTHFFVRHQKKGRRVAPA